MREIFLTILSVSLVGLGLAMDAFAVSVCDGISISNINRKKGILIALTFGLMQGLMPLIGYFIGALIKEYIDPFDHWIAFVLLGLIGGKMIFDGIKGVVKPDEIKPKIFSYKEILIQGVATSIDALLCGLTLAKYSFGLVYSGFDFSIFIEIFIIIIITFTFSTVGVILGKGINRLMKGKYSIAEIVGGVVLIALGTYTLIEGLLS